MFEGGDPCIGDPRKREVGPFEYGSWYFNNCLNYEAMGVKRDDIYCVELDPSEFE